MTVLATETLSPRAFTEAQAALYIGMSRSFLANSRASGHLQGRTHGPLFIKIGRAVRYLRDDLDRWLHERQRLEFLDQVA